MPGKFVVFEGPDGSGKTTQVARAADHFRAKWGEDLVVQTKDLGGSKLGENLRRIMYEEVPPRDMAPGVLDLLFLAGHVQNWHTLVKPAIEQGKVVVSDRWWLSQFAYAVARKHSPEVNELYWTMRGAWPDLVVFLYGDPAEIIRRANSRPDASTHQRQKTWNQEELQTRVLQEYCRLYSTHPGWWPINVDGKDEQQVWTEVLAALDSI